MVIVIYIVKRTTLAINALQGRVGALLCILGSEEPVCTEKLNASVLVMKSAKDTA